MPGAYNGSKLGTTYAHTAHGETHSPGLPDFAQPQREGTTDPDDGRGGLGPLGQLLALPARWDAMHAALLEARDALIDALGREVWANRNDISNAAQDGTINAGTQAFKLALAAHPSQAVALRNVTVGTSTPAVVQLAVSRSPALIGSNPVVRNLHTVRTTASQLTVWVPAILRLEPEENLFLVVSVAACNFDLSCEYRVLRG